MISTPEHSRSAGTAWDRFTAPSERWRRPFRSWRRGRPFFAGLSILLAGLEIYWAPHSSIGKMISMGLPGISSLFIPVFLIIFAITIWFYPTYRVFAGIASIMLALLSLVATNLGGFFIGFLLGMFGGAFAIAWVPRADVTDETRRQRRQRLRREAAGESAGYAAFERGDTETTAVNAEQTQPIGMEQHPGRSQYAQNTDIIEQAARPSEHAPEEE